MLYEVLQQAPGHVLSSGPPLVHQFANREADPDCTLIHSSI